MDSERFFWGRFDLIKMVHAHAATGRLQRCCRQQWWRVLRCHVKMVLLHNNILLLITDYGICYLNIPAFTVRPYGTYVRTSRIFGSSSYSMIYDTVKT